MGAGGADAPHPGQGAPVPAPGGPRRRRGGVGNADGGTERGAGTAAWIPHDVPLDRPSVARMYDYYLGGHHNFAVDRAAADAAIGIWPDLPLVMQANRAFLRRVVTFLAAQGID